jgi:hypothetical protein
LCTRAATSTRIVRRVQHKHSPTRHGKSKIGLASMNPITLARLASINFKANLASTNQISLARHITLYLCSINELELTHYNLCPPPHQKIPLPSWNSHGKLSELKICSKDTGMRCKIANELMNKYFWNLPKSLLRH